MSQLNDRQLNNGPLSKATAVKQVLEQGRKVISLQLLMTLLAAAGFFAGQGFDAAQAAVFGGLTSVLSTVLLSYGVKRATETVVQSPAKSTAILYFGAAQRFLLVLVCFAFGLAILKLYPLGVFAGFALAQIAYVISMAMLRK